MAQIAYVDWDGLVYYDGKIKHYIDDKLEGSLRDGGRVAFSDLPSPSRNNLSYIYTISEAFNLAQAPADTFDFQTGSYPANTAVIVRDIGGGIYRYSIYNVPADLTESLNDISSRLSTAESTVEQLEETVKNLSTNPVDGYVTEDDFESYKTSVTQSFEQIEAALDATATKSTVDQVYANLQNYKALAEKTFATKDDYVSKELGNALYINKDEYIADQEKIDDILDGLDARFIDAEELKNNVPNIVKRVLSEDKYATQDWVTTQIALAGVGGSGELDEEQLANLLANYCTKEELNAALPTNVSDLTNDAGYISNSQLESELANKGYLTAIPDTYIQESDLDTALTAYAKKSDLPVDYLTAKDLEAYAKLADINEFIRGDVIEATYLKQVDAATIYVTQDSIKNFVTTDDLDKYVTDDDINEFITADALNDYATKADLNNKADSSALANKVDISTYTSDKASFATKNDLTGKVDTTTYNDYATETAAAINALQDAIGNISDPADVKLFAEDNYVVGTAIGSFAQDDSVKELTLKEILIKLLDLAVKYQLTFKIDGASYASYKIREGDKITLPAAPTKEGYTFKGWFVADNQLTANSIMPGYDVTAEAIFEEIIGPTTITEYIEMNQLPMYQIDENLEVNEIPFTVAEFTEETATKAPSESTFFKVMSGDDVIQAGYQHVSEVNDAMYYVILLPNELDFDTNLRIEVWDEGNNTWVATDMEMTSDEQVINEAFAEADLEVPEFDRDRYTLWLDTSLNTCSGADFRFIINE